MYISSIQGTVEEHVEIYALLTNVNSGGSCAAGLCHPSSQIAMAEQIKEQTTNCVSW
jgi:hypothetical protein